MKILSYSGGKDSTASVILAHLHNEPIDEIIFVEVMFDRHLSGEYPEMIDFIKNVAFPMFNTWGFKTTILHSDLTYLDCFYHEVTNSKIKERNGKISGFPMAGACVIQHQCKLKALSMYYSSLNDKEVLEYVGIAIDEPNRRLKAGKESLLRKYGLTERDAYELCKEYGLISPMYTKGISRCGCFFCPNATLNELRYLRNNHYDLWSYLLELENVPGKLGYIFNTLNSTSIHEYERYFCELEDNQLTIEELLP